MILGKEYRYISPVFMCNSATGEVLYFKSIALTNTPAMDLILWKEPQQENDIVTMKEIAILAGLPESASPDEITSAIVALRAKVSSSEIAAIPTQIAATTPVTPAITSEREKELESQLITMRSKIAEEAVDGAIAVGQLTELIFNGLMRKNFTTLAKRFRTHRQFCLQ